MKMTDFTRVFQPIPLRLNYRLISTIRYLQRLFIHKKNNSCTPCVPMFLLCDSENDLYQRSYQPGLLTVQLDKKHLQKRHCTFRREHEPTGIPAQTHNVWAARLENLFLLFTNVSVWLHWSNTLWETSLSIVKLKCRTKRYSLVIFL